MMCPINWMFHHQKLTNDGSSGISTDLALIVTKRLCKPRSVRRSLVCTHNVIRLSHQTWCAETEAAYRAVWKF